MSGIPTERKRASIHSQDLPFDLGEKRGSERTYLANLLGLEFDGFNGSKFRLVEYDPAGAVLSLANSQRAGFKKLVAGDNYRVTRTTLATDLVEGETVAFQQTIAPGDYFWLQVDGRCRMVNEAAGAPIVAGDLVTPGGTTPGAVQQAGGGGTTYTDGVSAWRAMAGAAAGAEVLLQHVKKSVG